MVGIRATMHRVDIKLGFDCNNRCVFCVQGDKRLHHEPRTREQIEGNLREGRGRGMEGVVLTGGEPTLHTDFLSTVRLARKLGYSEIQVQTNGRLFCYRKACRAAIAAGATEFSPALHGDCDQVHDALTGVPGSYQQTVAAIRNLVELGQKVVTNTVVNAKNYRRLPDMARRLVSLGVDQFQLAFLHIAGTAYQNREWLVPRKRDVMPHVFEALEVGRAAGVRCMTEAIPFCLMKGYEEHIAERIIPETLIYDADQTIDSYTDYRRTEGKGKAASCGECRWNEQCEGPWREYPEMFGWDEFVPVPRPGRAANGYP
jgi:MoaA/NifB/PqqE/SkfB family radical SAM enzyme